MKRLKMKKFISFPKIGDLKSAVRDLIHHARYLGDDDLTNNEHDITVIDNVRRFI